MRSESENVRGIIRARSATAASLATALKAMPAYYSEKALADRWLKEIGRRKELLPFGWYQPPPGGVSVLAGNPPLFERLAYRSLRDQNNWPAEQVIVADESVLYPYFSAVDRRTGMIGDFVGTFYAGGDQEIREWLKTVYRATLDIASFAQVGMPFRELFEFSDATTRRLDAKNNTFSQSGGLANDIGHTVPGFNLPPALYWSEQAKSLSEDQIVRQTSNGREFLNRDNPKQIGDPCAFTIEPQMLKDNLPMASFHLIIIFSKGKKIIVEAFDQIFDALNMTTWIKQP